MTSKTHYQTLFSYHWHTNLQLMEQAAKLSEDSYKENPGYGRGSIHDLLFHILRTDQAWRAPLDTGEQPPLARPEDCPDLHSLQVGFEQEQRAWQAVLQRLSDEEIDGNIELTSPRGEQVVFPRWFILQHVILHGMQHHTEVAQLLTAKGRSPGDIDFIFFR